MVEAEGVQERGLEVVDRHDILDRLVTEIIGLPVGVTPLEAAAGEPEGERVTVVVSAVSPLRNRQPSEFTGPDHHG